MCATEKRPMQHHIFSLHKLNLQCVIYAPNIIVIYWAATTSLTRPIIFAIQFDVANGSEMTHGSI